jgi:beta-galactosidase GanA
MCFNGFWICGTNEVALHYVIKENTFWMRVLTEPEPWQPKIGPEIIIIDVSDNESLDENCKGNSSRNVNRNVNHIAAAASKLARSTKKPVTKQTLVSYKIIFGHNLGNFFLSLWNYKIIFFFRISIFSFISSDKTYNYMSRSQIWKRR